MTEYAVLPFEQVIHALQVIPASAANDLSGDDTVKQVKDLLSQGYRWVRTDGGYAIFERTDGGRVAWWRGGVPECRGRVIGDPADIP